MLHLDLETFGNRLRQARENVGLSQEELAVRVAKNQRAISQYERGKRRMFVTDLLVFAEALEVPLAYFFTGEIAVDELDEVLLTQFHRLSTIEAKQAAIRLVEVFCDFEVR